MMRRACPCGRILYDDVHHCPSCGRRMEGKPVVYETRIERDEDGEPVEIVVRTSESLDN